MDSKGYVRLFRSFLEGEIWENPLLWRLASYCIVKAARKPQAVSFRNLPQPLQIGRGQFVTGRKSLHREIFPKADDLTPSESTVWRGLERLESLNFVNRCVNSLYTIVSVSNYETYDIPEMDREQDREHKQSSDTDALSIKALERPDFLSPMTTSGASRKISAKMNSSPGQKYFAFVTVDIAGPYAEELFRAARYDGNDGAIFWRAAACWHSGLFQEGHVLPAAVASRELGRNKPAYFRSCLADALGGTPERLDGILRSVKLTPFLPKRPPEGMFL